MKSSAGKLSFDETKFNESMEETEQETESGMEMTTRNLTDSVSGSALTTNLLMSDRTNSLLQEYTLQEKTLSEQTLEADQLDEELKSDAGYRALTHYVFFKNYSLNEAQNLSG